MVIIRIPTAKLRSRNTRRLTIGSFDREFPDNEGDEGQHAMTVNQRIQSAANQSSCWPLVEDDLQGGERQGHQAETDGVDLPGRALRM